MAKRVGRLCTALVGTLLLACCQTANANWAAPAALGPSASACQEAPDPYYTNNESALQVTPENAQDVLNACDPIVHDPGGLAVDQLVNAFYFAAVSRRLLAERENPPYDRTTLLSEAETFLNRALALRDDFHLVRLERIRVYRAQALLSNSQAKRQEAIDEIEELQRRLPESGDPIHLASHFQRAQIFIDIRRARANNGTPGQLATVEDALAAPAPTGAAHADVFPTLSWDSTLRDLLVFTDSETGAGDERLEHPDRREALDLLAQYANALGCHLIPCSLQNLPEAWGASGTAVRPEPAMTRSTVQRAIDYFSLAQSAVDAASTEDSTHAAFVTTYAQLGRARLFLAGLAGGIHSPFYGCSNGAAADQTLLAQASNDLGVAEDRVTADDDRDIRAARACALLARGDLAGAEAEARLSTCADTQCLSGATPSAPLSPASAVSFSTLARVKAAQEAWDDALSYYAQAANSAGVSSAAQVALETARVILHSPPSERISDSALNDAHDAHRDWLLRARQTLDAHPSSDPLWIGRLERGKIQYALADEHEDHVAVSDLALFSGPGRVDDNGIRAESLLFLSRLRTRPPLRNRTQALRDADDAFSLDGSWRFREQACLVRLQFGLLLFSQAGPRAICGSADDAPIGEGQLLEGMYHLRRAFLQRAGDREREWEDAFRAFDGGLAVVPDTPEHRSLRERLQYGRGTAQYCIGFSELGNQAVLSIGAGMDAARSYFASFGVADCPGRRWTR